MERFTFAGAPRRVIPVLLLLGCADEPTQPPFDRDLALQYSPPAESVLHPSGDAFLRRLLPNRNYGDLDEMWVRGHDGLTRGLVQFGQAAVESAVGGRHLVSAHLEVEADQALLWGPAGRFVGVSEDETELVVDYSTSPTGDCYITYAPLVPYAPPQRTINVGTAGASCSWLPGTFGLPSNPLDVGAYR